MNQKLDILSKNDLFYIHAVAITFVSEKEIASQTMKIIVTTFK